MVKNNKLISVSVVIAALSIAYYFVIFLPQRDRANDLIEEQANLQKQAENCREVGTKYHADETSKSPRLSFFNPEFIYSRELNTCLYYGGFLDGSFSDSYIKDLNTNKTLASYASLDGEPAVTNELTLEDFKAKKQELFK